MIRWLSAGESHGPAMGMIIEGLPAGFKLDLAAVNAQLARRQQGYGRGGRQKIEQDEVTVLAGMRHGRTLGSPLMLLVPNRDHANWSGSMAIEESDSPGKEVRVPRPGHADYAGAVKYGHRDLRNVLERASARETVNRVLVGAVARQLLLELGMQTGSHVLALAGLRCKLDHLPENMPSDELSRMADESSLRVLDRSVEADMIRLIDNARESGDTLGGIAELRATGLPIGLGSHVHWDRRLDGRIGQALLSLPAVKGVEIGPAFDNARMHGRQVMDSIMPTEARAVPARGSNRMGGLEGGITNGEELVVRVAMKPLPTLRKALPSVNLDSGEACSAHRERSDVCALPALSVTAEHALNFVLLEALLDCCPADHFRELERATRHLRNRPQDILGSPLP